jgi:hypothetical protein
LKAICCFLLVSCVAVAESQVAAPDRSTALDHQLSSPLVAGVNIASAKVQLSGILSRPEFRRISREPSAMERWKKALEQWLSRRFARMFNALAQHPATSQLIFWIAAVGACGFLAFLLFRIFGESRASTWGPRPTSGPGAPIPSNWVMQALLASERGEFNKGIQCLYWAAVNFLQASGALPRAAGLTPRELARKAQATSVSADLNTLTGSLERFWYACLPASAEDFAACVRCLEALGCKVQ